MACLSSRVPYGEPVTPEKLRMIEEAEYVLRDLGFHDVRVRHHELSSEFRVPGSGSVSDHADAPDSKLGTRNSKLALARIEVGPGELRKFLENGASERVAESLRQIGYAHVTLDLAGYRRGSLNAALA
jgi:uncharacterized protein